MVIHLFGVPSKSIRNLSIAFWSLTSRWALINAGAMISLTFETALVTPLIISNLFLPVQEKIPFPSQAEPLSRNSSASWIPVEAPEGTAALCNPVSKELVGRITGEGNIFTGDKVDFYSWITARVVDGASSDLFDGHDGIESIEAGN